MARNNSVKLMWILRGIQYALTRLGIDTVIETDDSVDYLVMKDKVRDCRSMMVDTANLDVEACGKLQSALKLGYLGAISGVSDQTRKFTKAVRLGDCETDARMLKIPHLSDSNCVLVTLIVGMLICDTQFFGIVLMHLPEVACAVLNFIEKRDWNPLCPIGIKIITHTVAKHGKECKLNMLMNLHHTCYDWTSTTVCANRDRLLWAWASKHMHPTDDAVKDYEAARDALQVDDELAITQLADTLTPTPEWYDRVIKVWSKKMAMGVSIGDVVQSAMK